VPVHPAVQVG